MCVCVYVCVCVCRIHRGKKKKERKKKKKKETVNNKERFFLNYYQSKIYRCESFRLRYASYSYISYILLTLSYYYYFFNPFYLKNRDTKGEMRLASFYDSRSKKKDSL